MSCARQTLPLKGGALKMPLRHFFPFFSLFGKENWHKRKTLPWIKEKACSLLSEENCVVPTQSISTGLCRGKMGKEVLSTSQCQGQSDQAMARGVHIRNGGLRSSCTRPTVPGWEWGEQMSRYIPGLLGCFLDLSKPWLNLFSKSVFQDVWKVWVIPQSTRVSRCRKGHPGALSASLGDRNLTKDGDGWTDQFSGAVASRDTVTFMRWVWMPVLTAILGASWLLFQISEDWACWGWYLLVVVEESIAMLLSLPPHPSSSQKTQIQAGVKFPVEWEAGCCNSEALLLTRITLLFNTHCRKLVLLYLSNQLMVFWDPL